MMETGPQSHSVTFGPDRPLHLECGRSLTPVTVAYETYGQLNDARSNVVLVCHALSGDQYAANIHPVTGKPGWWAQLVGPGLPVDTDKYFVICSNVLGACMGTTGPACPNPETGQPYGVDFPVITIRDMVTLQRMLLDRLGIEKVACILGGSMGGMQALQWLVDYPSRVGALGLFATSLRHTAQNIALHEVGRQAIFADPNWKNGRYLLEGTTPAQGLGIARMIAHITYLSEPALDRKFGRRLQNKDTLSYSFDADFQIESYLRHQGNSFVERFDANSYLYITRAMDYFDLLGPNDSGLKGVLPPTEALIVSFTSDWLFPISESDLIAQALGSSGGEVRHCVIETDKGHDAFLLDEPEMFGEVRTFLERIVPG